MMLLSTGKIPSLNCQSLSTSSCPPRVECRLLKSNSCLLSSPVFFCLSPQLPRRDRASPNSLNTPPLPLPLTYVWGGRPSASNLLSNNSRPVPSFPPPNVGQRSCWHNPVSVIWGRCHAVAEGWGVTPSSNRSETTLHFDRKSQTVEKPPRQWKQRNWPLRSRLGSNMPQSYGVIIRRGSERQSRGRPYHTIDPISVPA